MNGGANSDPEPSPWLRRLLRIWVLLAAIVVVAGTAVLNREPPAAPPEEYGTVPEFSLVDQRDGAYGTAQLLNGVWVANFIFTRCKTVCPMFSAKMADVQTRLRAENKDVTLVSFSVDPDFDTPEVLAEYAERFNADPDRWRFLTGASTAIRTVVVDGMKMHMEDANEVERPEDLMHGSHFVLVDGTHTIRGFYNVNDADTVDRLMRDIDQLVAAQGT